MKPNTNLPTKHDLALREGQKVGKTAKKKQKTGGKNWQDRTYDLAVTSTYWPGRKCAAYRGVPAHKKQERFRKPSPELKEDNSVLVFGKQRAMNQDLYTWLDDGIVRDFKGGGFLFWRHSCIPEHLHFLL